MVQPTHIDLFSGIGGFSLAAKWAGFRTVLHCEIDPYCQKVLRKNFPEVPIHGDIHTLDGRTAGAVDLVTGGFPCQPFSIMGKRGGDSDDRFLWPEMLRCIAAFQPAFVCAENVAHFVHMGLGAAAADLEDIGYQTEALVFPACAVGADFIGYRTFLLAAPAGKRGEGVRSQTVLGKSRLSLIEDVGGIPPVVRRPNLPQPHLLRSRNGVPNGVDRLHALGNAVVPQQVYPILAAIAAQL